MISEAIISASVVQSILKTDVDSLVNLSITKLQKGSSMSCTIGGWNAQAANIVAAMFIATGQVCKNFIFTSKFDNLRSSIVILYIA